MTELRPRRGPRALRGARRFARYLLQRRPVGAGALDPAEHGFLRRAAKLAFEAEQSGNVPIGAVIVLEGRVIAEGRNSVYQPLRHPGRHAETEALRHVPDTMAFRPSISTACAGSYSEPARRRAVPGC